MPTYDLTVQTTPSVSANKIGALRSRHMQNPVEKIEAYLDISKLVEAGVTILTTDVFRVLNFPANMLVLSAGAEVITPFNGTSPAVTVVATGGTGNIVAPAAAVTAAGYLPAGANGSANLVASANFAPFRTAAGTVDVTLTFSGGAVTQGVLRVYLIGVSLEEQALIVPTEVRRDQRA